MVFSSTTRVRPYQNVAISNFIGDKDDGGDGDNWSYKSCKAPVKSSSPTNQHPMFYRLDALPVTQPTVSQHSRQKASHSLNLLTASSQEAISGHSRQVKKIRRLSRTKKNEK